MENKNKYTSEQIKAVKDVDMVGYLSHMGIEPKKIRGNDFWYFSPLRDEKTPSFKINRQLNVWYDHGLGKGGNIIDFAILYHNCTVGDFFKTVIDELSFHQRTSQPMTSRTLDAPKIEVTDSRVLSSTALLNYLRNRRIDLEVAERFCRQITFRIGTKMYYGIGLQNDNGGWAIRTPFMKSASTPNGSTSIKNGSTNLIAVEGQFEFLSYQTIFKNSPEANFDFHILNSVNNIENALPKMAGYTHGYIMMNNDKAGQNVTDIILNRFPYFTDKRIMFAEYNDINDWHCNIGRPPKAAKTICRSRSHGL